METDAGGIRKVAYWNRASIDKVQARQGSTALVPRDAVLVSGFSIVVR